MHNILFVNRYFYPDHSATSQLLADLAFALADEGYRVVVITSRQMYEDAHARLPASERVHGVAVKRVATTSFGRGNLLGRGVDYVTFYVSATVAMLGRVRSGDVLIAKTDPPLLSIPAAAVAKVKRARLVNWVQDVFPEVAVALGVKAFPLPVRVSLSWLRDLSWRFAWRNVVLGERMKRHLLDHRVEESRMVVIHNWADGASVRPIEPYANKLRSEWNLDDKFVVGYSGNLGRAHEFHTIIEAAGLLAGLPDIIFLFIGGGAQIEGVKLEVARRGLRNIVFKAYQPRDRLAESLSVSDLHLISLLPELEGFIVPSKFYGIAAAGRPSLYIGDKDGEIARMLQAAQCGEVFSIGDAVGIAQYVAKLAEDPAHAKRMGLRARELFDRRFDKAKGLSAWVALIQAAS